MSASPTAHRESLLGLLTAAGTTAAIVALVAWLLYHRIHRHEALDQTTRLRIYEAVRTTPGLRASTLADQLGLSYNTVKHHLKSLERCRYVRASSGYQRRYFPAEQGIAEARTAQALAQPVLRAVHSIVVEHGEVSHTTVARILNRSRSSISRAMADLERSGLVNQTRVGRHVIVRSAPRLANSPALENASTAGA